MKTYGTMFDSRAHKVATPARELTSYKAHQLGGSWVITSVADLALPTRYCCRKISIQGDALT